MTDDANAPAQALLPDSSSWLVGPELRARLGPESLLNVGVAKPGEALVGAQQGEAPRASASSPTPSILSGLNPNARGTRNNNPGNLEANPYTASMPGYVGSDERFAKFATPEQGIFALKQNLTSYALRGISTPLGIASTWAPGSESGNNPGAYGSAIAAELGVQPGDKVDLQDPHVQDKVARAIAKVENGGGGGGGGNNTGSSSVPPAPWSPPSSPPSAAPADLIASEMKLQLLRNMFPQHAITPVEYDPFKAVPKGLGGKVNVNEGVGT